MVDIEKYYKNTNLTLEEVQIAIRVVRNIECNTEYLKCPKNYSEIKNTRRILEKLYKEKCKKNQK